MFQAPAQLRSIPGAVATVGVNDRVAFLRRTYAHLGAAILAFVALSAWLQMSGVALGFTKWMVAGGRFNLLIVFGLFIASGAITQRLARSETSVAMQYFGLALGVLAYAIFLSPMLLIAREYVHDRFIIQKAGLFTLLIFGGLTATVFITRKDFSFLRGMLAIAAMAAFGIIISSIVFDFQLGSIFSVAMIVLMAGYILYQTSLLMAYFHPRQHVAASLMLFSTIATLFLYVLRLLMSMQRN
jgi:FtsH-binding integral membrane protein